MATIDINAILNNLPRSTKENPNLINPNVNMNMTPSVQPGVVFSKPRVAQSNQPNFFQSPIPGSRPNMRPSILDTTNNQPNMNQAFTEAGLLDQNVPVANQPGTPPNRTNNLLNFVGSPQGQAFFAGIDTRASQVPTSLVERLQPGYQAYLKSKSDQIKLANEKAQLNKQYELDLYKAYTDRISALSKDNRTTLEKDMATLFPNLQPGSSDYQAQALKYIDTKSTKFGQNRDDQTFIKQYEQDLVTIKEFREIANQSKDLSNAYINMERILDDPDMSTGVLQEALIPIKQLALSLGLLSEEEAKTLDLQLLLRSFTSYVTPRMRPVGSGASSDFEQALYGQANVQIGNSESSNKLIVKARASYSRMNEAYAQFADDYLRNNKDTFSLKSLEEAFDKDLLNNRTKLERILGTQNIFDNDDDYINAVKNGKIKVGDVFYDNDINDDDYGKFKILRQEDIEKVNKL
jgi:hypothetical protein